jgi:maltose alpha-D-glucosyltransferase/alpha-amylase
MGSRPLRSDPAAIVALLSGPGRSELAQFLIRQRWFAAKTHGIDAVRVEDWAVLEPEAPFLLLLLDVDHDRYYLPITVSAAAPAGAAVARKGDDAVVDAHDDPRFARHVLAAIAGGRSLATRAGLVRFLPTPGWPFPSDPGALAARRLTGEQSNTSLILGRSLVLKSLRRPQPGTNPDVEIARFLAARTRFRQVPHLAGDAEYVGPDGRAASLALLQEFVDNTGDGWRYLTTALEQRGEALERRGEALEQRAEALDAGPDPLLDDLRRLGEVTAGLHVALASDPDDPDFRPEPVTQADVLRWTADITRDLQSPALAGLLATHAAAGGDPARSVARALAALEPLATATVRIRGHGDYHLGQVLKTADDFVIIDFEGEPARPLVERRAKHSPLRDVAGMLRSLDYAAHAVAFGRPEADRANAIARLLRWEQRARRAFLDGYRAIAATSPVPLVPVSDAALEGACAAFELEKACYELRYELDNRPDWAPIPLAGIARILSAGPA